MGKDAEEVRIKTYNKKNFDFGEKKAFPMREQHFFCSIDKAVRDLDWKPAFNLLEGLQDSYENDFKHKKVGVEYIYIFSGWIYLFTFLN
jgi:nucleoside-diphosphate-sugar epimerase